ncbi:MAG: glutathione S-transferase [Cyanobacteria bacterium QH_8_48_120]|jgi:glutathione S-transferase|nr:MAG: glutathione S-transferase [Cyanobacteria bacterium QH_1_48_107]PSO55197.1 MAG: glutathione S-transferase [Cyanobacteria bacterium QH_10_48_56]PSO57052.1 MAG: glutathione S-transferase [Cyanobacteria bacterium QH_7_48_89]PSO61614.1 MAG: glutathione S-transferase [Cyanobacteria bacterium QH_2_48_84]PSO64551.1 MAG: glutathione S-transferase [Cyanobacteria bacterium QH_6_48_35]PSO73892.1 MAG: glutathione S-transferase [Cyanobacteria bacterium QH_8_48_120]PSO73954.1 MAG: glutathione S-tran
MLKLYGGTRSRASIVQWYLEEREIPYEFVQLNLEAGEHQQPEYLAINPFGKVPAIVDGDFQLWESGAILLYLAEKSGELPESIEARMTATQWVLFANATLGVGLFVEASRERETPRLLSPLNQILERQAFLLGDKLTVADVAVGSYLAYASMMLGLPFSDYPAVDDYVKRLSSREAFTKTIGKRPS